MIIEPRIHISDEEFVALKQPSADIELALEIAGRVQNAVRGNSFNTVQFVGHESPTLPVEAGTERRGQRMRIILDVEEEDLRALRRDGVAPVLLRADSTPDLSVEALLKTLEKQDHAEIETGEGLRTAFACTAEDGSRAIVIAVDPIDKWPVKDEPGMEILEQLIWLKGVK